MEINNSDILFYLLISFFSIYIILQIFIVLKMRVIVEKLIYIMFRLDGLRREFHQLDRGTPIHLTRSCKNCKNRIPFYFNVSKFEGYFYYRCKLTKKQIPPDYLCERFIFDPQTYDV